MLINSDFEVAAPVDRVWAYLLDVPRMAPNLPGTELTEIVDEDTYHGRVSVRLGPVALRFTGTARITERDEPGRRVVLNATGAEERGKGQAAMVLTATLERAGMGTRVTVAQDLQISGAAAQFGRGMITDVTGVLLRRFAVNVAEDIDRWSRGEERVGAPSAPARGFTIGAMAAMTALRRVFWRFFGSERRRRAALGRS